MNSRIEKAQELSQSCGLCGLYIPSYEPILIMKVSSPKGGYYKVPVGDCCAQSEADLWGYYQRYFTGRQLTVTECCVCQRTMMVFVWPNEKVPCSARCRRIRNASVKQELARRTRLGWRVDVE